MDNYFFILKARTHALGSKLDLKAKKQSLMEEENKMEDDGKDEDLEELGERREERGVLGTHGLGYGCVMGMFPLSSVGGMRLDQLVGGGGFPFGRWYRDSHMWVDGEEILSSGEEGKGREKEGGKGYAS